MLKGKALSVSIILLVIVVDVMGAGLFMPLVPNLFWGGHPLLLDPSTSNAWRQIDYGLSFSFWAMGVFFGAPLLGEFSDRIGRKKILLISLIFVMASYLLSYLSIVAISITLFMLSRLINGFFASSFPIAQAIIIDISSQENRGRNLGWVTLASSLGVIIGPLLSSFSYSLGGEEFGASLAFISAAGLAGINFLLVFFFLKETGQARQHKVKNFLKIFASCRFAFTDVRIRYLSLIFVVFSVFWGFYFQGVLLALAERFNQTPTGLGWFYAFVGLGLFFMTVFIQPYLLKNYRLKYLCMCSMFLITIICVINMLFQILEIQWLCAIAACMAYSLCYIAFATLFSKLVNADEQGKTMGGIGALFALTLGIVSLFVGVLSNISVFLPILISAPLSLLGGFLLFFFDSKR